MQVRTSRAAPGYGRPADVWALGCVIVEMFTGRVPWGDEHTCVEATMYVPPALRSLL